MRAWAYRALLAAAAAEVDMTVLGCTLEGDAAHMQAIVICITGL